MTPIALTMTALAVVASEPAPAVEALVPGCGVPLRDLFSRETLQPPMRRRRRYRLPDLAQREALVASLRAAVTEDLAEAVQYAEQARYDLCRPFDDPDAVVWRPPPGEGRAVIAWRGETGRPVILEVPHPYYDLGTSGQGVLLFRTLGARVLIHSGTHRCASRQKSGCDGATAPCGPGPHAHRISDAAHSPGTLFHAAHETFAEFYESDWVVSLHGMAQPGASLSDGTTRPAPPTSPVALLAHAFQEAFPGHPVTSCNALLNVPRKRRYCGTTNVQGRHVNLSPDPCSKRARTSTQRFVHIEQSLKVRVRTLEWLRLFDRVLPP